VDLLGILSGVALSKFFVGTSAVRICALYVVLQACEIFCMYQQLRSVQYKVLNFERMYTVMERFCDDLEAADALPSSPSSSLEAKATATASHIPTPAELAVTEPIFLPPRRLARRANAFGSLSRAKLSPGELEEFRTVFRRERFLLVVGPNLKRSHGRLHAGLRPAESVRRQENCHIVLHKDANNLDIVKSTLALALLRRRLAGMDALPPDDMRSSDCMDVIAAAYGDADRLFARFLRDMSKQGWESPARFMFGRVHMRADWPLSGSDTNQKGTAVVPPRSQSERVA
jgi:Vitamin B6 photo-protection and homoeostasis